MSYLQGEEKASTVRVLRARYEENDETLTDEEVSFEGSPGTSPELLGGRLALTGDGYLFLSLGDRWESDKAQDLSGTAGTIVRIRTDGTIPDDNPFRFREGARPEIWSYGHRNPQGLAFDRATGELWSDEHGPQGGDELNLVRRGGNCGWPLATFGVDYSGHPIAVNSEQPGTASGALLGGSLLPPRDLPSRPGRRAPARLQERWWCSSTSPAIACSVSIICSKISSAAFVTFASIQAARFMF
jgi:glucose/arabinose dehydrogenase